MTFLVVGVDRATLARWHDNITADDAAAAAEIARRRASRRGIALHNAAVIGPNSSVVPLSDGAAAMRTSPRRAARS